MPDWLLLALAILACYRLARLSAVDEGPAGVLMRLRIAAGGYDLGENGEPLTNIGRGMICPHCWGVWWAGVLAVAVFGWQPPMSLLWWLAIAGGQSFLWSICDGAFNAG